MSWKEKEKALLLFEGEDAAFEELVSDAKDAVPFFDALSGAHKAAVVSIVYDVGKNKLASMHGFLNAMDAGDFDSAALHLMNTAYARRYGDKVKRLVGQIREDRFG